MRINPKSVSPKLVPGSEGFQIRIIKEAVARDKPGRGAVGSRRVRAR
jgi:hypothetical protein